MIIYPNLSLEPPVTYNSLSDTALEIELSERIESEMTSVDVQLSVLLQAVDKAYASTYHVLGEKGNDEAAHGSLGMVQLLKRTIRQDGTSVRDRAVWTETGSSWIA